MQHTFNDFLPRKCVEIWFSLRTRWMMDATGSISPCVKFTGVLQCKITSSTWYILL